MTFRVEREISEPEDPRFPECLFVERLDITFLRKMRSIPYPNTVITSTAHQLRQRMKFPGVLAAKSLETCWYFRPLRRYFRSVSGSEPFIRPKFMPTGARVSAFSPTENTARILYMEHNKEIPLVWMFSTMKQLKMAEQRGRGYCGYLLGANQCAFPVWLENRKLTKTDARVINI